MTVQRIDVSYDSDTQGNTYTFISIDGTFTSALAQCKYCATTVVSHNINHVPSSLDDHKCPVRWKLDMVKAVVCATANRFF